MILFWIISLIFSPCGAVEQETPQVGVQEMMRYQTQEGIELLRNLKERAERAEKENNSLASLTEEMVRDTLDAGLQSKVDILYSNKSDLSKELKFIPVTYNCGKEFDIYKLLLQVKRQRNMTTEKPKCLEEVLTDENSNAGSFSTSPSSSETATQSISPSQTVTASIKLASTPKRNLKKADLARKIPEAPVAKDIKPEKQNEKNPLPNGQSLDGSQIVAQPGNGNIPSLILNPASSQQVPKAQTPQILKKAFGVVKQPLLGKGTADKTLLGKPLSQTQVAPPTLKTSLSAGEVKNPKTINLQALQEGSLPNINNLKIPQMEYVYSE